MQSHVIRCQISAFAILAEMEAMKTENKRRESLGEALAYSEKDFLALAHRLEVLAIEAAQAC